MKKSSLLCILFLLIPIFGFSNTLGNISGDIGVEYSTQKTQSNKKTEVDKLSEVLNLNYRNYLYDRRILDYYFNLRFSKSDENGIDNDRDRNSSYQNSEYDLSLNFLQKSFMPFQIKAKHTEKPSTIINEDSIVETTFNKTDYSLRGNVDGSYLNVAYNVSTSESDTSSLLGDKVLNTNSFGLNFSKEFIDESRLNLGLSHSNSNTKILYGDFLEENRSKNTISASYVINDISVNLNYTKKDEKDEDLDQLEEYTINTLSSSIQYKFSDELIMNNSFETEENGKNDSQENTGNIRLRWAPSKSYDALLSIDTNEYRVEDENYENYGLNISSNYRINKNWSNSQNLNFLDVYTPASTHRTFLLSTTTNYKKSFSPKTNFYANNSISYIQNDNSSLVKTTDISDDQTIITDSNIGVDRKLDFWNASNGYDLNYKKSFAQDSDSQEIKLSTYLNTFPAPNIEYILEADISKEDKNEKRKMTGNIKNLFRYSKNMDVRGRLTVSTGLNYKFEKEGEDTIKSFEPSASLSFNYRLWRTLSFKTLYDIMIDERNKVTNHKFNTGFQYKFRNFEVYLTSQIIKQDKEKDDDYISETFFLGMKRKF